MKVVAPALCLVLSSSVFGDGCIPSVSDMIVGKSYRMRLRGGDRVRRVRYLGSPDGRSIEFGFGLGRSLRVFADRIDGLEPVSEKVPKLVLPPPLLLKFYQFIRRYLIAHRTLARRGDVRVVGPLWHFSAGSAPWVARVLEEFDKSLHSWGLRTPPFTEVLLVDRPLVPGAGTGVARFPLIDIRSGRLGHSIALDPHLYDVFSSIEPTTIRRERVRSALLATFTQSAPVNKSGVLGMALADFLSAHFSGSPKIGFMGGAVVHDIGSMRSRRGVPLALTGFTLSPYTNSLALSNLLWRFRGRIGADAMDLLLPDLVGGLNAYGGPDYHLLPRHGASLAYEYLAAVVSKVAGEHGYGREAREVLGASAKVLSLDVGPIETLSEGLVKGDGMLRERTSVAEASAGYAIASVFFAMEVYLVVSLLF